MNTPQPIALITGASKGLGRALAVELVDRGYTVIAIARSKDALSELQSTLTQDKLIPYVCDVADPSQVKKVSKDLQEKMLIPSLFFLNAGLAGEEAVESPNEFRLDKHRDMFSVNYFGALSWVEEWLPTALKGGKTIFMATGSMNAYFAPPQGGAYAASKAAIAKAFEGLSLDYHDSNVTFSVVFAGPIATKGRKGNLPFTWKPEKMACYMVDRALRGKQHVENSLFYGVFMRLLQILPNKYTMKILSKL